MPMLTYDSRDFKMIDLVSAEGLEIQIDRDGKIWINLNGKCLLRIGEVANITLEDARDGSVHKADRGDTD